MANTQARTGPTNLIERFIRHEAFGGGLLVAAAALALAVSNSALASAYQHFLAIPVSIKAGAFAIEKPVLLWINDGLMAVFFFLVGLEIKREVVAGELSSLDKALLPAIAASAGLALPAAIYAALNRSDPVALNGWAIPAATDIAFALGVLALLGKRVPPSLKVFLLAVAVLDDLACIAIIAIFYTQSLSLPSLVIAGAGLTVLAALNLARVAKVAPYLLVGIAIWAAVLKSGVHATLAGVAVALTIPMRSADGRSPLAETEESLHGAVAYAILPLFAFANAGVSFEGIRLASLLEPVPLGIALGLFLGKQIGVFGATWIACATGLCRKPEGANWRQIYGIGMVCGIGFTMSLFIGSLAFATRDFDASVRLGVLAGSALSAVGALAWFVLFCGPANGRTSRPAPAAP